MRLVITGGHHTSALPVIDSLLRMSPGLEIYWFGHRRSMKGDKNDTLEFKDIASRGIPFYDLKAGKFYKTYNIFRIAKIPYGFIQALYYLIRVRPSAILSFGGYLAVPTVIAGYLLGIPSLTHEQTTVAGYANRLISKFTGKIMVSWPNSMNYYDPQKTVYTGLPLRDSIFAPVSSSFETHNNLPYIFILAGKTGSHLINDVIGRSMKNLLSKYNLIHQCGDHSLYSDFDHLESAYTAILKDLPGRYFLRKFISDNEIGESYSKASVVVTRAGAHTTYEILALNKPSVLIPIPWVSHNEQEMNARTVVEYGLGRIIEESELTPQRLDDVLTEMLSEQGKFILNREFIYKKDAANLIADETIKILEHKKSL